MVFEKNQEFKVKKKEDLDTNKYLHKINGNIYRFVDSCECDTRIYNGKYYNVTAFNTDMQSKDKITVAIPINQHRFIGDDGWNWWDWMIYIPKENSLMQTE